ncbi:hypothetical protein LBMAG21_12620 [Armatimonadota bacterium]|nr:hypothetical protein LBMAG21_12620 [Armatimonadota bacterium]
MMGGGGFGGGAGRGGGFGGGGGGAGGGAGGADFFAEGAVADMKLAAPMAA